MTAMNYLSILWFVLMLLAALAIHVRNCRIANLERSNAWLNGCNQDLQRANAQKDLSIEGHLRDSVSLLHELERLKREAGESWDTNELRGKAWLAKELQP